VTNGTWQRQSIPDNRSSGEGQKAPFCESAAAKGRGETDALSSLQTAGACLSLRELGKLRHRASEKNGDLLSTDNTEEGATRLNRGMEKEETRHHRIVRARPEAGPSVPPWSLTHVKKGGEKGRNFPWARASEKNLLRLVTESGGRGRVEGHSAGESLAFERKGGGSTEALSRSRVIRRVFGLHVRGEKHLDRLSSCIITERERRQPGHREAMKPGGGDADWC